VHDGTLDVPAGLQTKRCFVVQALRSHAMVWPFLPFAVYHRIRPSARHAQHEGL
jgi:hypothetical protein